MKQKSHAQADWATTPLPIPTGCGDSIAIDFIGPLPEDDGYNCIVTITDYLGADICIIPTQNDITAAKFAALFFDKWYCENGLPLDIVSDRDKLFCSQFWQALHQLTGVELKMSSSFYPETDGSSERSNKMVVQALQFHVQQNQKGWACALPRVCFDIMNSLNESTGFSPFQLHIGRAPQIIPPLFDNAVTAASTIMGLSASDATALLTRIELDTLEAQDNLTLAKISQVHHANKHRGPEIIYQAGDRILLSTLHRHC